MTSSITDRQVMADAILGGTTYLITSDVDDFAFEDLAASGMSAANPDYFMASRFTERAYMEGVELLAAVQKNRSRSRRRYSRRVLHSFFKAATISAMSALESRVRYCCTL